MQKLPFSPASSWLTALIAGAAAVGIACLSLIGMIVIVIYPQLPSIAVLTDYRPKIPLRIYTADGHLMGEFGEERRNFVPISQIPKVLQDAVLAIEDVRIKQSRGVIGEITLGPAHGGAPGLVH